MSRQPSPVKIRPRFSWWRQLIPIYDWGEFWIAAIVAGICALCVRLGWAGQDAASGFVGGFIALLIGNYRYRPVIIEISQAQAIALEHDLFSQGIFTQREDGRWRYAHASSRSERYNIRIDRSGDIACLFTTALMGRKLRAYFEKPGPDRLIF